jgi:hypothetical protein
LARKWTGAPTCIRSARCSITFSAADGSTAYQLVEAILRASPTPLSSLRPELPGALDEVVARAMARSRERRFGSWQEFASSIAQLLALDGGSELSDAEKFAAARRLRFFDRFNDADLWQVVHASTWRNHPAGSALIREGTADERFYVLASGMLKVTQRGKLLNVVTPGECVGEMAYARRDGQPRSATVTAVEPSWAMSLRVQEADALPESCRGRFNEAFLAIMAERLAMLSGRLVSQDAKVVV